MHRISERETRKELIDPALEAAKWYLNDRTRVGLEIPVDGYDKEPWNGITDYCLYRPNGKVIAVVEAKRATHGPCFLNNKSYVQLFMVFGEPDVTIQSLPDGKMSMTIKGVDVYDPTTAEIHSSSTDDIACWFIDTSYNGESFFVRHAYFTRADEPYEKLKRALREERLDQAPWVVGEVYFLSRVEGDREKGRGQVAVVSS